MRGPGPVGGLLNYGVDVPSTNATIVGNQLQSIRDATYSGGQHGIAIRFGSQASGFVGHSGAIACNTATGNDEGIGIYSAAPPPRMPSSRTTPPTRMPCLAFTLTQTRPPTPSGRTQPKAMACTIWQTNTRTRPATIGACLQSRRATVTAMGLATLTRARSKLDPDNPVGGYSSRPRAADEPHPSGGVRLVAPRNLKARRWGLIRRLEWA